MRCEEEGHASSAGAELDDIRAVERSECPDRGQQVALTVLVPNERVAA
jgi:hypothetical protein